MYVFFNLVSTRKIKGVKQVCGPHVMTLY